MKIGVILGLAYKANVDDDRESPSYILMEKLEAKGATVAYNDPNVPVIRPSREHAHFAGRQSAPLPGSPPPQISPNPYDLILISTAHDEYKVHDFSACEIPIVDSRNCVQHRPKFYYQA